MMMMVMMMMMLLFGLLFGLLDVVVVSFRGTQADSLRNWAIDLKYAKLSPYQNYTGVQVHSGFQTAYLGLKVSTPLKPITPNHKYKCRYRCNNRPKCLIDCA
jgi:hypothetical protein